MRCGSNERIKRVVFTHVFLLSLSLSLSLQDVGVLPQPAERQFLSSEGRFVC